MCKIIVKTEKEASWIKYGKDLSEKCRLSTREFYKSVKAMRIRNEPFDPTTIINDAAGKALHNENKILEVGRLFQKPLKLRRSSRYNIKFHSFTLKTSRTRYFDNRSRESHKN